MLRERANAKTEDAADPEMIAQASARPGKEGHARGFGRDGPSHQLRRNIIEEIIVA